MNHCYNVMIDGGVGLMRKCVVIIPYMLLSPGGVAKLLRRWKCCVRRKVGVVVMVTAYLS